MAIIPNDVGVFVSNVINSKYDIASPTLENFPTHYDQNGHGGFMAIDSSISEVSEVESLTGKYDLIIPFPRRKVGMVIYDINPQVSTFYQCTDAEACSWEEVDFRFRYFYGPTAPTASDIQVGEKWFDTVVGSEYTYLPIADGSTYKAWIDIDHIGEGETFSGYITVALANTYYVNVSGDEMTGSLTAEKMFRSSSDTSFEDDELVTKSYVSTNYVNVNGNVMTGTLTGTEAKFSGSVTAAKFYGTQPISEDTQLATKQYVDNNTIGGVSFYIDGQESPFATSVEAISLSGGSNVNIEYDQSTTPNRYVISASLSTTDEYVNVDGDVMTGTLTGPFAAFEEGITTPNAFIGTLTGNYVKIGSDPSYILNFGTTADQSVYSGDNPNVPVINSQGGVLIGGNTYTKQNWLGNNVYLAPEGHVFAGIPSNIPTDWFDADGGTYPFDLYSLNVTGGIHTDRAYRWGHKKGQNTFEDHEFITKKFFQDNEFRLSSLESGKLPHFHIHITATKGSNNINQYAAGGPNWAHTFASNEIGFNPTTNTNDGVNSLYADLTESIVGFPKPWAIKIKRHFYSRANNQVRYYPPHSTRSSDQNGSDPPYNTTFVNTVTTSNDVRIRWNGYIYSTDAKDWFETNGIGVDTESGKLRIKMATYTSGWWDLVYGDTYITEIIIVPG